MTFDEIAAASSADLDAIAARFGASKVPPAKPTKRPQLTVVVPPPQAPVAVLMDMIPRRESCLMDIRSSILDGWLPQIPQAELAQFIIELQHEIDDIKQVIKNRIIPSVDVEHELSPTEGS